ncbi:anaphase-promoting complex APC subunit CDC26 domain-containing protein [Sarocladium implicatum]|nr:anaphase-promoting complex APC subunit CDC26 domain-containing protein [Sarocladium implicatum]
MPSVRRLINHTRNRSEDAYDSADASSPPSVSSTPPKHRRFSPQQRSPFALPTLGKVTSADSHSSTRKGSKPPQISAPRAATPQTSVSKTSNAAPKLPVPQLGERASMLAQGMGHSRSTSSVTKHRRNVSEGTKTAQPSAPQPPSRKGTPGGSKGQQMMKPPPLMHQRPLKAIHRPGSAPQRSSSLRQAPTKPAAETSATLKPSPLKRPSLVSHSSDSFISIRASGVRASIASDPGTDIIDRRSKDDLDMKQDVEIDYSDDVRNFMLEAEKAFQLGGDPRLSLAARRRSLHPKTQPSAPAPPMPSKPAEKSKPAEPSKPSQSSQPSESTPRPVVTPVQADSSRTATPRPSIPRKSVGSGSQIKRVKSPSARPCVSQQSATVPIQLDTSCEKTTGAKNVKPKESKRFETKSEEDKPLASKSHEEPPLTRFDSSTLPPTSKSLTKQTPASSAAPLKKKSFESKPRWNLGEGMTDILTGQRFKKTEVDEMLTPERMNKLRLQQEAEEEEMKTLQRNLGQLNKTKSSTQEKKKKEEKKEKENDLDSSWIDLNAETPDENHGAQLSSSNVRSTSPDVEKSLPPTPGQKDEEEDGLDDELGEEIPIMFMCESDEDLPAKAPRVLDPVNDALPPIPTKSKLRHSMSSPKKKAEAKTNGNLKAPGASRESVSAQTPGSVYTDSSWSPGPATPENNVAQTKRKLASTEDEVNIYLQSTPYTLTRPEFKHGAITLPKADMGRGAKKMDDTMDWTAFQMAILGGAGDVGDIVDEWEDSKLADELVKWFDDHGFEDWGRTVQEQDAKLEAEEAEANNKSSRLKVPAQSVPKRSHSPSSSTSSLSSVDSTDFAYRPGHNTGATPPPLNIRRKQPPLPTLTSRCMPKPDGSLGANLPVVAKKSPAKGPAVVGGEGPGDVDEHEADAPMGFNLNNDLGEYLQYEAEYARHHLDSNPSHSHLNNNFTPSTSTSGPPELHTLPHIRDSRITFDPSITPYSSRKRPSRVKMLRRAPTTLTITSEDVAAYEDRREREALIAAQQEQRQQQQQQAEQGGEGHAMEGVQASPEATRRARDERIGVSRRR